MIFNLEYSETVVLVGAGPVSDALFKVAESHGKIFIAVDGGGNSVTAYGMIPDAVIGDMDSLSDAARAMIPPNRLLQIAEQDSTDFDKAVRNLKAPLILAIGFTGARLDHELAALHVLARYPHQPIVLLGEEDVTVHLPRSLDLHLEPGTRLSLFPLDAVTVFLEGLRWSFEALDLHPIRRIGTSNEVAQPKVRLGANAPGGLLIVPHCSLNAVIAGLRKVDFHSPPG